MHKKFRMQKIYVLFSENFGEISVLREIMGKKYVKVQMVIF